LPYASLQAVAAISATDAWIVGSNSSRGLALRWDGASWTGVAVPNISGLYDLSALSMVSPTDGWAVGANGGIIHWDGNAWSSQSNPSYGSLHVVDAVSAGDIWASGDLGKLLHGDGATWAFPTGAIPLAELRSIAMASVDEGWAVGDRTALHWNGTAWQPVDTPPGVYLNAVDAVSPVDAWAVGNQIVHWDGAAWSPVDSPTPEWLSDVDMVSVDDGWAVGGSYYDDPCVILHWDGIAWSEVTCPVEHGLNAVAMVASDDGWAMGGAYYTGPQAIILHWDGIAWTEAAAPSLSRGLLSISMASASDGWAVGYGGIILHWDGQAWSQVANPFPEDLVSVSVAAPPHVWALGRDEGSGTYTILYGNGRTWVRIPTPSAEGSPWALAMIEDDGWAVGYGGQILRYSPFPTVYRIYLPGIDVQRTVGAHGGAMSLGGRP
ncbi:MAG TPA: hypothetical protein VL334_02330, partial [Anaerolineae bacterium]|nr:hypothetical protein [Anaerolineae bacterium]